MCGLLLVVLEVVFVWEVDGSIYFPHFAIAITKSVGTSSLMFTHKKTSSASCTSCRIRAPTLQRRGRRTEVFGGGRGGGQR